MAYDPLSPATRRTRRALLAVASVGILESLDVVKLSSLPFLGAALVKEEFVGGILFAGVIYLSTAFYFYLRHDHQNRNEGLVNKKIERDQLEQKEIIGEKLNKYWEEIATKCLPQETRRSLEVLANLGATAQTSVEYVISGFRDETQIGLLQRLRALTDSSTGDVGERQEIHDFLESEGVENLPERFAGDYKKYRAIRADIYEALSNRRFVFDWLIPALLSLAAIIILLSNILLAIYGIDGASAVSKEPLPLRGF